MRQDAGYSARPPGHGCHDRAEPGTTVQTHPPWCPPRNTVHELLRAPRSPRWRLPAAVSLWPSSARRSAGDVRDNSLYHVLSDGVGPAVLGTPAMSWPSDGFRSADPDSRFRDTKPAGTHRKRRNDLPPATGQRRSRTPSATVASLSAAESPAKLPVSRERAARHIEFVYFEHRCELERGRRSAANKTPKLSPRRESHLVALHQRRHPTPAPTPVELRSVERATVYRRSLLCHMGNSVTARRVVDDAAKCTPTIPHKNSMVTLSMATSKTLPESA